jgi:hypothetical protein
MPEFFDVQIYGGEFNSDETNILSKRMPNGGISNGLIAFVEALPVKDINPNIRVEEMTCVFVLYILNKADRGLNGYSKNAYAHGQKLLQLIKNNNFGFRIAKKPEIMSFRNITNQIKQDQEIAKMALVWTQNMPLAETDRFN